MDALRIFAYLHKRGGKCGSKEVSNNLGLGLRKTQHILKSMKDEGFISCEIGSQYSYKVNNLSER